MNCTRTKASISPRCVNSWFAAVVLGVAVVSCIDLRAQQSEFSPYSRYGFGLVGQLHTPVHGGLGGMETTLLNSYQFQPTNPASATYLSQTTFQASGIGNVLSLKTESAEQASVGYGSPGPFGMVIKRQSGKNALILGLAPYSNSGYAITRSADYANIGMAEERYEGEGGMNNLNIGWAHVFQGSRFIATSPNDSIRVQNRALHLGVQTQYLFGQISRTSTLDILDPTFLDHRNIFTAQHRSVTMNIGGVFDQLLSVQYSPQQNFERSYSMRIGAVYTPATNLHSNLRSLDETTQTLGGIPVNIDTAFFSEQLDFRGRMPRSMSVGSSIHFDRADGFRLAAGVEYKTCHWQEVADSFAPEMDAEGVEWKQSQSYHVGVQFNLGSPEQRNPTWGKATYQMGISQQFQPYEINGTQVLNRSVSAGFTLPMVGSRSLSRMHFGTEIGERTTVEGALNESYLRIHIGVSLMPFFKNNWLIPRLYD